jgi:hypothetical protein
MRSSVKRELRVYENLGGRNAMLQNLKTFAKSLKMVSRAGLELNRAIANTQVIDSKKRQKRQNRYLGRTEVHGGYTGYEFVRRFGAVEHRKVAI